MPLLTKTKTLIIACLCLCIFTGEAKSFDIVTGGATLNVPVKSFKELRFENIVRQHWDFSCGSAALATLLKYNYEKEGIEEKTLLEAMIEHGDREKIVKEGFSMLDMKNYLNAIGLHSAGYRTSLDKLKQVGIPAIAIINNKGYAHFIVINGVVDNVVIVRDPAFGNRTIERSEFEKIWNGILFVINDEKETARKTFHHEYAWKDQTNHVGGQLLNSISLSAFELQSVYSPNYFNF